jgi:HAD superfamily hydrolase (TIGR01549 family)
MQKQYAHRYSTLLFDFDGTLSPSLPHWLSAYKFALAQFGHNLTDQEVITKCFYRSWADVTRDFQIASVEQFERHIQTGLQDAFEQAHLFDGVVEVLQHCRDQGIRLGIVTSASRSIVSGVLERTDILKYFSTLVTADDITNFKPHPEPLYLALKQLGSTVEESLMVGDSHADMLAAKAAGMDMALFFPEEHKVYYEIDELKAIGPHHIFSNYQEIALSLKEWQTLLDELPR